VIISNSALARFLLSRASVVSVNNKYGDLELFLAVEEQIEHKNPTLTVGVFGIGVRGGGRGVRGGGRAACGEQRCGGGRSKDDMRAGGGEQGDGGREAEWGRD
jgi:hypothetical protein